MWWLFPCMWITWLIVKAWSRSKSCTSAFKYSEWKVHYVIGQSHSSGLPSLQRKNCYCPRFSHVLDVQTWLILTAFINESVQSWRALSADLNMLILGFSFQNVYCVQNTANVNSLADMVLVCCVASEFRSSLFLPFALRWNSWSNHCVFKRDLVTVRLLDPYAFLLNSWL